MPRGARARWKGSARGAMAIPSTRGPRPAGRRCRKHTVTTLFASALGCRHTHELALGQAPPPVPSRCHRPCLHRRARRRTPQLRRTSRSSLAHQGKQAGPVTVHRDCRVARFGTAVVLTSPAPELWLSVCPLRPVRGRSVLLGTACCKPPAGRETRRAREMRLRARRLPTMHEGGEVLCNTQATRPPGGGPSTSVQGCAQDDRLGSSSALRV